MMWFARTRANQGRTMTGRMTTLKPGAAGNPAVAGANAFVAPLGSSAVSHRSKTDGEGLSARLSRKGFLKGSLASLGLLALGDTGLFAAPAGWKPSKKPRLVFGVMSDSHLMVGWDGVSQHRGFPHTYIRNAFKLFKQRGIDAFLHLGDASHRGAVRELEFHRERFEEVFGKSGGPAKILVSGNHEFFGDCDRIKRIWPNKDDWKVQAIKGDFPRNWERGWGEKYEACWHRVVNGYHFFGRHWDTKEQKLAEFIKGHAESCGLKGGKPFFILSHVRNHHSFRRALMEFPNAVAFFGHWHCSNADWKTIYYDGWSFPEICCGACRNDGQNTLDANENVLRERETTKQHNYHNNKVPSRQAMVVNVYDDMVVFERHEVGEGGKLGPDWVMPLNWRTGNGEPGKGNHPFSRGELAKAIGNPQFGKKARLALDADGDSLKLTIPLADGNPDSRVFAYDVVAIGDNPQKKFFRSVYFEGCNLGIGHEPNGGATTLDIPKSELPEGKDLTIAVRPLSSLGTKGRPLVVKYSTAAGTVRPRKAGA